MSPAMVIGKAKMIGKSWVPDLAQTDALLSELSKIRTTHDVVIGENVAEMIDLVLDYRRDLSIAAQAKELMTWPPTTT